MHISVTREGTVTVHGSHRLAARLHGRDLEAAPIDTLEHLTSTGLLEASQLDDALRIVELVRPVDLAGWQVVVCGLHTPELVEQAAVAYRQRFTLETREIEAHQHVHVWRLD